MQNISESLSRQREQVLREGEEDLLSRHTSLLEIAIISLYNRLVNSLDLDAQEFRSSGAVVASGPLGRGLIGPNQTVSIVVLMAESLPWKQDWLDEIILPLRAAGWVVEAEMATPSNLVQRAREDFDFFLRLLEVRYISGNRQLVEQLNSELRFLRDDRQDQLISELYGSYQARLERLDDENRWLEPDLIHHPGGLRDIDAIRMACRIAANVRSLEDAIFKGYLDRQEVDFLQQSEKKYMRLLNLLQNIVGHSEAVLRFDVQETLAEKMGYSSRAGFLPVEAFMQEIHQLFSGVFFIAAEFWERLHENRVEAVRAVDLPEKNIEEGVLLHGGKIHIKSDKYPPTPRHLVRLFALSAKHKAGLSNATRRWIQHHRNVLDSAAGDFSVTKELLDLIANDDLHLPVFRRFYNQGLLISLIPELAAVHGLVQHDAFHVFPVHEHHLRTLSELKKLFAGEYAHAEKELSEMAERVEEPMWLFLGGLLHDIGKSAASNHALHGGEMIPAIARRLGLNPQQSDMLQFLVAQHLLLMDSASLRDLADEEMLAQCALVIKNSELLDCLLLLSFADMKATGPKARQKWRDTPVVQLHERLSHLLEKGEPSAQTIAERIDQVRTQVGQEVADLINSDQLDRYLEELAPRYLLSTPPDGIARHLRMELRLLDSGEPFIWEALESDGSAEVTLICREMHGLLARTAGILTLHDLNITSAQVFTKKNGVILLIFQCRLPDGVSQMPDWEEVKQDFRRLLEGKISLEYRIAARAARKTDERRGRLRLSPSKILIDNESSAEYTILEVYTTDRVGLLYTITWTLVALQVRIYVAKITTKVDQVADVFYIKTTKGEKVTDPEQLEEIRNALLFWLDGPAEGK